MKVLGYLRQHAYTSPFLCKRYIRDGPHHNNFSDLFPIVTGFNGLAHLGAGYHRGFFFSFFLFGHSTVDWRRGTLLHHSSSYTSRLAILCIALLFTCSKGHLASIYIVQLLCRFRLGRAKSLQVTSYPTRNINWTVVAGLEGLPSFFFFFGCLHTRSHAFALGSFCFWDRITSWYFFFFWFMGALFVIWDTLGDWKFIVWFA